jgi:DNA polymerase III subunit epsilon
METAVSLPRRALIIDTETTGLDPKRDVIVEVAVCLYDLQLGTPIASFAALARGDSNAAEHINGIPVASLAEAFEQERLWVAVCDLMASSDVVLAHNASFDKSFVEASAGFKQTWDLSGKDPNHKQVPWVCTLNHVQWPGHRSRNDLASLALSLGVPVIAAHRAMTDVDTLVRILTRTKELGVDLQKLIGDAMAPRVKVCAVVSFAEKDKAKAAGFTWEADKKQWTKEARVGEAFDFKTRVIP